MGTPATGSTQGAPQQMQHMAGAQPSMSSMAMSNMQGGQQMPPTHGMQQMPAMQGMQGMQMAGMMAGMQSAMTNCTANGYSGVSGGGFGVAAGGGQGFWN